jgi:hypothetical protein
MEKAKSIAQTRKPLKRLLPTSIPLTKTSNSKPILITKSLFCRILSKIWRKNNPKFVESSKNKNFPFTTHNPRNNDTQLPCSLEDESVLPVTNFESTHGRQRTILQYPPKLSPVTMLPKTYKIPKLSSAQSVPASEILDRDCEKEIACEKSPHIPLCADEQSNLQTGQHDPRSDLDLEHGNHPPDTMAFNPKVSTDRKTKNVLYTHQSDSLNTKSIRMSLPLPSLILPSKLHYEPIRMKVSSGSDSLKIIPWPKSKFCFTNAQYVTPRRVFPPSPRSKQNQMNPTVILGPRSNCQRILPYRLPSFGRGVGNSVYQHGNLLNTSSLPAQQMHSASTNSNGQISFSRLDEEFVGGHKRIQVPVSSVVAPCKSSTNLVETNRLKAYCTRTAKLNRGNEVGVLQAGT